MSRLEGGRRPVGKWVGLRACYFSSVAPQLSKQGQGALSSGTQMAGVPGAAGMSLETPLHEAGGHLALGVKCVGTPPGRGTAPGRSQPPRHAASVLFPGSIVIF